MNFDPARVLRASNLRAGPLRARGVPAILFGSAAIVLAVGLSRAVSTVAPQLPELVREMRQLIEVSRQERPSLRS